MKYGFVSIAYNGAEYTRRLFDTAISQRHEVDYHLFLHSLRHPDTVAVADDIGRRDDVTYHRYGFNRGLAKSWNDGILACFASGCQTVIVANHDIAFGEGDLDAYAECAVANSHAYCVTAGGYHHRFNRHEDSFAFSVFAINPIALEQLGCFDENFFPIYFEDSDYIRRARLLGLQLAHYDSIGMEHGGSMAIHSDAALMQQHESTFPMCHLFYKFKWGGSPDHEVYAHPFNNPEIALRIAPEDRNAPYAKWGQDRQDQEVVKL